MILVTGGAGFIGSNVVRALNARGRDDVVVVDDLTDGGKFENLVPLRIIDYWDRDACLDRLADGSPPEAIIHQGACSDTTETDGRYMLANNYDYSRRLLDYALEHGVPFIYASSAAVYGAAERFVEAPAFEAPLNVYGYSKLLFDQHVRRLIADPASQERSQERGQERDHRRERKPRQIVGLRYFNVYGPGEGHKGRMASVAWQHRRQLRESGEVRLFEGSGGFGPGEQRRDFVYVDDVVAVVLWFLDHPEHGGIYNVGTGRSQTFNEVARAVLEWSGRGEIVYVPFPPDLAGRYQSFTQADLSCLRETGCPVTFREVAQGVSAYMAVLDQRLGA